MKASRHYRFLLASSSSAFTSSGPFQTTATLGYDNVGSVGIRQPVCGPEFAVYD
jgi:hypothetical protein